MLSLRMRIQATRIISGSFLTYTFDADSPNILHGPHCHSFLVLFEFFDTIAGSIASLKELLHLVDWRFTNALYIPDSIQIMCSNLKVQVLYTARDQIVCQGSELIIFHQGTLLMQFSEFVKHETNCVISCAHRWVGNTKVRRHVSVQNTSQKQLIQQLTRQMIEALGVAVDVSVWMIGPAFSFGRASLGGGQKQQKWVKCFATWCER